MHENSPSPGTMRRFDGQAALITAAGQGIGRAIALRLADEGAGVVGNVEYSAAKAGQVSLTQNLAAYYGPRGVRFNVVSPGTVRTPHWDHQAGNLERMATMYPLGRVREPADIAAAVAFLASDDAAWVTGITLPVEGGLMTGPFRPVDPLTQ